MTQKGVIKLDNDLGQITVPEGFGYLDANQSEFVIKDLWGNPSGDGTLGMLVPEDRKVYDDNSWAFIITYDEIGYVKDDDADDIDYDDLLEEMKTDMVAGNEERKKLGYGTVDLVGWASKPFYDADKKTLHWAKELKFDGGETNTLNYNVRILGRKGVLVMNAVSTMDQLPSVKENIDKVHASFAFTDGSTYKDFDPKLDEVAAWTIGGLVAGKVLAKVGFFAIFLKYIKLILIGLGALGTGIWKWITGRKEQTNPYADRGTKPDEPA